MVWPSSALPRRRDDDDFPEDDVTEPDLREAKSGGAARAWMTLHRAELEQWYERWRASEIRWSWVRLIMFFAAVLALYMLRETAPVALVATAACVVLFGAAIRRHHAMQSRREFGERLLEVADESLQRCGGRLTIVRDGERPRDPDDAACLVPTILESGPVAPLTEQERDDLDLYASPVGLFGLLDRASTPAGARRLRDLLERPCLSTERITARQACVRWLNDHAPARVRMMAAAAGLRRHDKRLEGFIRAVRQAKPLSFSGVAMRLWSVPSAIFTVVALTNTGLGQYRWGVAWMVLMAINVLMLMPVYRSLREAIAPWRELPTTVRAFLSTIDQAAKDLPDETELSLLRDRFSAVVAPAVLPVLCRRLGWTDTGGFIHVLCNVIFFYDLHVAHAVLRRVVPNRDALIDAAGALADLEALCGLACFGWEQPVTCTPTPSSEPTLAIVGGVHPLVDPEEVVANDVHLTPAARTWVITGSNMAGKSTFLRMVGINVVLAQIGADATAREMAFQPRRPITDLRIRDDLSKHESYFLAEVRQLRRMLAPQDDTPLLGLIDEPFRGTNSEERIAADVAVVGHLIDSAHFFLVATHEQQLAELAEQTSAQNHHFHEDLTDGGAVFDYHLRPGPATARNALRILEREGYPATILERAQGYLRESSEAPDADE